MEISEQSADLAFVSVTEALLDHDMIYGLIVKYPGQVGGVLEPVIGTCYDEVQADIVMWKGGNKVTQREWLILSGFPQDVYLEHGEDLLATARDERVTDTRLSGKSTRHNFFGRLCRKQASGISYIEYMLDRFSRGNHKSFPHFHFDVEPKSWLFENLMKNPNQIRCVRVAATCCVEMFFRYIPKNNTLIVGWIMRHAMWTHLYEDIYCPWYIAQAVCKHIGITDFQVQVFFVSLKADTKTKIRSFLDKLNNNL